MPNISALGLDTSNYTTSAAFFGDSEMDSRGMILPVKEGEIGLRQSDAVFHHTRQLPEVLSMLGDKIGEAKVIGVSERPRDAKDSYMPCFLVGIGAAQMLAQALGDRCGAFRTSRGTLRRRFTLLIDWICCTSAFWRSTCPAAQRKRFW